MCPVLYTQQKKKLDDTIIRRHTILHYVPNANKLTVKFWQSYIYIYMRHWFNGALECIRHCGT